MPARRPAGALLVPRGALTCALLAALGGAAATAEKGLESPVSLESRYWSPREFGYRLGLATGLRFAAVDGISGRGRAGRKGISAARIAAAFEEDTGIRAEVIGGTLVLHRPNQAKRREMEARLATGGGEAVRAAWLLGWLKDANAWPALAAAAAGKDVDVALAAAQALRRLDGEEGFHLRHWILDIYKQPAPSGDLWQVPLGTAFREPIGGKALGAMAGSSWIPLREAAVRIAPGCADGKALVEKLAADPSHLVRTAAQRALRTWEQPGSAEPPAVKLPDLAAQRADLPRGGTKTKWAAAYLATYGTDEDHRVLAEMAGSGADNAGLAVRALAENGGGPRAVSALKAAVARGGGRRSDSLAYGKYGLAMLLDGAKLAEELGPSLGEDHWGLSSEYLLARFAGPPALAHLERDMAGRGYVAAAAAGFVGGPDSVGVLSRALKSEDLSTAVAAGRGLGDTGLRGAVNPLIGALSDPNRVLRGRAALGLGRIGGPEACAALVRLLTGEKHYLVRRAACRALKEIGSPDHRELVDGTGQELDSFAPAYGPVGKQFGGDFPTGRWVDLKSRPLSVSSVGETRMGVDAYAGLLVRYGGCSPCYGNECVGYDTESGRWFVIRPPENLGMWGNEPRPTQGCSRGMTYDPASRRFWMDGGIGGSARPYNKWIFGSGLWSYDAVLDRFDGRFDFGYTIRTESGSCKFLVAAGSRGLIVPEAWGGGKMALFATSDATRMVRECPTLPEAGSIYPPDPMAYDPVSGSVLRASCKKARGLWLYNVTENVFRKSAAEMPGHAPNKHGMAYDALNREVLLFLPGGVFRYDRGKDTWESVAAGDGHVYLVDFDVENNVFLALRGGGLSAFRYKNVPAGTRAFYGDRRK